MEKTKIMTRTALIEYVEKYICMMPPHVTCSMVSTVPVRKQPTHVLRFVADRFQYYQNN